MGENTGRRTGMLGTEATTTAIEAREPAAKRWVAWDDKVNGSGAGGQRAGAKSFIVKFGVEKGGPLKRVVIDRVGEMLLGQARQRARLPPPPWPRSPGQRDGPRD